MSKRFTYYGSDSGFNGLFNLFSNGALGLSLRLLDKNYIGNCIRVRRSSDNAEQDIGFLNNALNQSALLSFVGAGDGFIVTWYDQSGNNYDVTNAAASNQPKIVSSGVVETKNGNPSIFFDGLSVAKGLARAAITELNNGNSFSFFNVAANRVINYAGFLFGTDNASGTSVRMARDSRLTPTRNLLLTTSSGGFNVDLSTPYNNTNQVLTTGIITGSNVSAYDNGNLGGSMGYTGTYNNNDFHVGFSHLLLGAADGPIQEIVMFSTDKTSQRVGIESNIDTYYAIP